MQQIQAFKSKDVSLGEAKILCHEESKRRSTRLWSRTPYVPDKCNRHCITKWQEEYYQISRRSWIMPIFGRNVLFCVGRFPNMIMGVSHVAWFDFGDLESQAVISLVFSPFVFLNNGCHEEGYEEGSCTCCTCGPPSHEEGKGHEGDEKVKDGSMKLVAQAIKDQLSRTFQTLWDNFWLLGSASGLLVLTPSVNTKDFFYQ